MKRAAEAIIAALSVQSETGTSLSRRPSSSQSAWVRARSSVFAATPPPSAMAGQSPAAGRAAQLRDELIDDRPLEGGGEVGPPALGLLRPEIADLVDQRRLQSAEAEVEAAFAHRHREVERLWIASLGRPLDRRSAWIAEAEEPSALVEGLACRVVQGLTDHLEARWIANAREQGVAAARDQAEERRLDRVGLEEVRRDVTVEVVDRDQRLAVRRGQRLGRAQPDQQRADQPGALGDRDLVDLGEAGARLLERGGHHRVDQLEVVARGDLGDDSAVALVERSLGGDDVGEDPRPVDDGGAGVVARRFESEDQAIEAPSAASSHMIRASSPLSW